MSKVVIREIQFAEPCAVIIPRLYWSWTQFSFLFSSLRPFINISFSTSWNIYSLIFTLKPFKRLVSFIRRNKEKVQVFLLFHCYVFNNHEIYLGYIYSQSIKIISIRVWLRVERRQSKNCILSFMYEPWNALYTLSENQ